MWILTRSVTVKGTSLKILMMKETFKEELIRLLPLISQIILQMQ